MVETIWWTVAKDSMPHRTGTFTLPGTATRPRSLRRRSQIMRFSARSFTEVARSWANSLSSLGERPRGRVPLIGLASRWPSTSRRKRSGEVERTSVPESRR